METIPYLLTVPLYVVGYGERLQNVDILRSILFFILDPEFLAFYLYNESYPGSMESFVNPIQITNMAHVSNTYQNITSH